MSKQQKRLSERRHRKVYKYLVAHLPNCEVTYNGEIGIDCHVHFQDKITQIEIKTCNKIHKSNIIRKEGSPILGSVPTLGRIQFYKHQNDELLEKDGWYVFLVGGSVVFGVKAKELNLFFVNSDRVKLSWLKVTRKSYPDWLERLRIDCYGGMK